MNNNCISLNFSGNIAQKTLSYVENIEGHVFYLK